MAVNAVRTQHVPADLWCRTLDDLSRACHGAVVSTEILGGDDVGAQPEVLVQSLRGLSSDRGGVTIRIAKSAGIHLEHLIAHPNDLRIVESDEGGDGVSRDVTPVASRRCHVRRAAGVAEGEPAEADSKAEYHSDQDQQLPSQNAPLSCNG